MTPSMRLADIKRSYFSHRLGPEICKDLERAFALGQEFGIDRAADVVDQCNKEGPYEAIGAASRIRSLRIVSAKPVRTIDKDFV